MDVKGLLYDILDEIGKTKIRMDIHMDIYNSKKVIDDILYKVILKIKYSREMNSTNFSNDLQKINFSYKNEFSTLCESFLHFLLTASTIPSSRKILINNQELDIVVPDVRILKTDPKKTLIIKFVRDNQLSFNFIDNISKMQPEEKNIWIVSPTPAKCSYRNYIIYRKEEFEKYFLMKEDVDRTRFFLQDLYNIREETSKNNEQYNFNLHSFNNILIDIEKFLKDSESRNFRFVHN
jgi:hypothetical protein